MEVDGTLLTILGVAAGILILTGWVEQIYKGYKNKKPQRCFAISHDIHFSWCHTLVDLWNNSIRRIYCWNKHCSNRINDDCTWDEKKIRQKSQKTSIIKE